MASGGSNELLSIKVLAVRWGISEQTVYKKYRDWGLTPIKIGKHVRFRARDIAAFETAQEAPTTAGVGR